MKDLSTKTLKDICSRIQYGYTASATGIDTGTKFLRITDIVPEQIDWSNVPYCNVDKKQKRKFLLADGDIVVARTGATVGYAKYVRKPPDAVFASYLVRFQLNVDVNKRYVGFIVESDIYKKFIKANMSGAAQPQANASVLSSFELPMPSSIKQAKITAILSAYDDLIENNNRRIKILERIAQAIYEEWFVKFRFPDRSKVKMVDSELGKIPEGWRAVTVKDIVKRLPAGKKYDNKSVLSKGKVPVLDQGRSGIIGYHNNEADIDASEDNPIIVFANHTCYQRLIMFPFSAIQNVIPILPSDNNPRDVYWLHWATKDLIQFNDYKGHYPEFSTKRVVLPPESLCSEFGHRVKPFVLLGYKLEQKNRNLQETRDILLPKLISGEIDVEDMDIDVGDTDDR